MSIAVEAIKLRGPNINMSGIGSKKDPLSFLAVSHSLKYQDSDAIDWWQWVLVAGLIGVAGFVTFLFRKPAGLGEQSPAEKRVILNARVSFCQQTVTRGRPAVDPVQLGVTMKGKTASGDFIELFHETSAHELEGGVKFTWDDPELSWIISQPSTVGQVSEILVSVEQYSPTGGLVAVVASGIVTLRPPIVGSVLTPRKVGETIELISTSGSASVWGSMDLSVSWEAEKDSYEQFSVAQKQILKKLKIVRPLFLASHSIAVVLVILDSFFGIRYLFSGCLVSSIQALVSAGLIALLSIPMAAEWGQMHYAMPVWVVKVGKLNSQFKATVLVLCAVPQCIISAQTGSETCSPIFSLMGGVTFLDFILFCLLFVQSEANGHAAALLHFNCFKRPLPPKVEEVRLEPKSAPPKSAVPSNTGPTTTPKSAPTTSTAPIASASSTRRTSTAPQTSAPVSPTSYAARRGKRESVRPE